MERFARKCSVTGKGINEGWYINGSWYSTQELADIEARKYGYDTFSEMMDDNEDDEDDYSWSDFECYWTEFTEEDIEEEEEYYTADGKLIHI